MENEPKIGDRKVFSGDECIFVPDPWAELYGSFPCWCKVSALKKDGYTEFHYYEGQEKVTVHV